MKIYTSILLALFSSIITLAAATVGTVCKDNSVCGSDECCYIRPAFLIASRRQASLLPVQPTQSDTGVCEKYRVEHEHCGPLEQANGHCGCGSGMSCQFVPDPVVTDQPLVVSKKRRGIYVPGPGSFQCEMKA